MSELKTLTYVVKMDIGDGTEKTKQFRTTIKTMEQDATKASVEIDKLAKTIGEKYNTKVSTAVDQTSTVKNEIKASAREASKSEKAYSQLAREYTHLASRTGKTADEQEVLNAQYRLGASATKAQKDQAAALVTAYQAQRKAATQTQGSMRGLRGQAQNLGWQLQDVAVQAQMGTNGLVILGQQGSQLASGFGPMGALIGAGIAVGAAAIGVLAKTMKETEVDTASLTDTIKSLKSGLDELAGGGFESSKFFQAKTIEQVNAELIKLDNSSAKVTKKMTKAAVAYSKFNEFNKAGLTETNKFNKAMFDGQFILAKNAAAIANLNEIKRLHSISNGRSIKETIKDEKATKDLVESLDLEAKTIGKNQRLKDLMIATEQKATAKQILSIIAAHDRIDAYEEEQKAIKKKLDIEKKATKELSKQLSEQAKMQQDHINTLAKYTDQGKLIKLQIQYAQEKKLLAGNNEALLALDEHYADERTKINGSVWEKMAVSAKESIENTDQMMAESLDRFVDGTAQAFGDAIVFSDNFGDAMKNVFKGALSSMISYFAELAIQQALMWAFTKAGETTVKTEQATSQAFINQASVFEAGLNAYKSTAAIPIVGPALAPAAAGAAVGAAQGFATAANSLNFAGAFDQGGMIPSGSAGIVSEFGDELVGGTMIYNGSQGSLGVTGREDTAKKMGGSNNNISVNSYGNASPDAIARAMVRQLKKPNKQIDNAVYDSMNRGRKNGGKRFNA